MRGLSFRRWIALRVCPELGGEIENLLSHTKHHRGDDFALMATHVLPFKDGSRPHFWHDIPVREAVIAMHRQMTLDAAITALQARFGAERTPSRSSLGRIWKQLDQINLSKVRG